MLEIKVCRACSGDKLTEFLHLGEQYLSDFREDNSKPPKYPLVAVFCEDCKLVQLKHTTPQPEMYHNRYGFKSGISESIKKDLNDNVTHAFQYVNDPQYWLDIASNDGTLLSFIPKDIYRVGVDPVKFLCDEAKQHADMIINAYFSNNLWASPGLTPTYDVITSISCFYDMPDPNQFVSDVKSVLAPKGVWLIQQNYLLTTMELSAIDNFCHEHLEYYTLLSLENLLKKHGLEVNEVLLSDINGGSIRTVVSHKGAFTIDRSVQDQREKEQEAGLDTIELYKNFAQSIEVELNKLRTLVFGLKSQGNRIAILAASTRGATIWQSTGLDQDQIIYAVERNKAKVGRNFSAIGVPIVSEEQFREDKIEYAVVGPWFYGQQIIERELEYINNGGRAIVPLPKVMIVNKENVNEYLKTGSLVPDL